MPSYLEEIIEQIKQHPRLIIAEDYEISAQSVNSRSRQFHNGDVTLNSSDKGVWIGLRVMHRKRPGKCAIFDGSKASIGRLVEGAFHAAESSTPDLWFRFPLWKGNRNFDAGRALPSEILTESSLYDRLKLFPDALEETYESWTTESTVVRKTEKVVCRQRQHVEALHLSVLNHHEGHYFRVRDERAHSRPLEEREQWLDELMKRSFGLQQSRPFGGLEKGEVVLSANVAAALLKKVAGFLAADRAQTGKGPFKGLVGQEAVASCLTIIDDATYAGGAQTREFDLEGCHAQRTTLVDKGVVKSFLYDTYWATRENRLTTGNFLRHPGEPFPRISPSNVFIPSGRFSPQALLSSVARGVIVEELSQLEVATNDELTLVGSGWKVERGSKFEPVHQIRIRLDLLSFLQRAAGTGSDLNFHGAYGAPSILFENMPLDV